MTNYPVSGLGRCITTELVTHCQRQSQRWYSQMLDRVQNIRAGLLRLVYRRQNKLCHEGMNSTPEKTKAKQKDEGKLTHTF